MAIQEPDALVVWRESGTLGRLPLAEARRRAVAGSAFIFAVGEAAPESVPVAVEPSQSNPRRVVENNDDEQDMA